MRKYYVGGENDSTDLFGKIADSYSGQWQDQFDAQQSMIEAAQPQDATDKEDSNDGSNDVIYGEADITPNAPEPQVDDFTPSNSFDDGFVNFLFEDRNNGPTFMSSFAEDKTEPASNKYGLTQEAQGVLQGIEDQVGDITVTSGRRSAAENAAAKGVPHSFHLTGQAIDLRPTDKLTEFLQSPQGHKYVVDHGYQTIDERNRPGHGAHWHLEPAKRQYGGDDGPGPKKPIYTNNINDPRLRAYQDSLANYNKNKSLYENGLETKPRGLTYDQLLRTTNESKLYLEEGTSVNLVKKPVQPVVYQDAPAHRASYTKNVQGDILPNLQGFAAPQAGGQSNISGRPQNPTDYSYSYRDEQGQQQTKYFPNWDIWNHFVKTQPFIDAPTNAAKTYGHATGHYLKLQDGGDVGQPEPPKVKTTQLTPQQEATYQKWKSALPKNLQYEGDYDLRGLYKSNPNVQPSANMHFPDTYKLPNHPTFSDESIYFNNQTRDWAGKWQKTDSSYNYVPYNSKYKKLVVEKF